MWRRLIRTRVIAAFEQKAATLDMNQAALLSATADDENDEEGGGGGIQKRAEDNEYVITDSDDSDGDGDDDGPTQGATARSPKPPKPCSIKYLRTLMTSPGSPRAHPEFFQ